LALLNNFLNKLINILFEVFFCKTRTKYKKNLTQKRIKLSFILW